nr:hypothetical protein [uncultured bacterium]
MTADAQEKAWALLMRWNEGDEAARRMENLRNG